MSKKTQKLIYLIVGIVCAISIVLEILFAHPHGHAIWHTFPGADVVIAFVGGWILILFAKKIMAPLLQRDENYYDGGEDKNE